eukprot:3638829-Pleurochrysis_carterae.AAC.1
MRVVNKRARTFMLADTRACMCCHSLVCMHACLARVCACARALLTMLKTCCRKLGKYHRASTMTDFQRSHRAEGVHHASKRGPVAGPA